MSEAITARAAASVVLIDDSDAIRSALKLALEDAGYRVLDAATGEAGLKLVLTSSPDALVTDYELPGINGMAVIHRVRSHPTVQSLPCILLTGADAAPAEARGLEGGADAYIRKTSPLEVIVARVGASVRRAGSTVTPTPTAQPNDGAAGARRVLVITADAARSELLFVLAGLKHQGLEVRISSEQPTEAELGAVECVLLDRTDALAARIAAIKAHAQSASVPVVVLGSEDDPDGVVLALRAGADDWVALASGLDVIAGRIRAHLRRRQAEDHQAHLREQALQRELADREARAQREIADARAELLAELARKNAELEEANSNLAASLREVRVRDEQFRTVARCVPGVVYLMRHGEHRTPLFMSVAVEVLTGHRAPDFVAGRVSWTNLVHPEDRDRVFARIDSAIGQRKPFETTYRIQHASGAWRWVEERGRAIFDEDEVRCVGGTVFDVTERLEAEEELERFRARQRPATPRP
ncbi:MAG: response regulator [bacterium]